MEQLRAVRRVARGGGRMPGGVLPFELVRELVEARAVRVDRVSDEVRLTHLGLLALMQAANGVHREEPAWFRAMLLEPEPRPPVSG